MGCYRECSLDPAAKPRDAWSRYLGIDFGHPWPKSPRKRAAMFAAAVLVAAPAPARLKESGLRS
ncbi:MAG: hypothetical protein GY782_03165, partial [Gammaproteobacteria bacterium]|nr:hypothetical protein [Gammaproteobacteria bacterium]